VHSSEHNNLTERMEASSSCHLWQWSRESSFALIDLSLQNMGPRNTENISRSRVNIGC